MGFGHLWRRVGEGIFVTFMMCIFIDDLSASYWVFDWQSRLLGLRRFGDDLERHTRCLRWLRKHCSRTFLTLSLLVL